MKKDWGKTFRKYVKIYLESYYWPFAATFLFGCLLYGSKFSLLSSLLGFEWFEVFLEWMLIISFLSIFVSFVYNLIKKRWGQGFSNFVFLFVAFFLNTVGSLMYMFHEPWDVDFGKDIVIPKEMKYEVPPDIQGKYRNQPTDENWKSLGDKMSLALTRHTGGIYFLFGQFNPIEPGQIYIKAFEATRNTPLSAEQMKERSTKKIDGSENPEQLFPYDTQLTVWEGDPGTYYPAKFEVWFVPESGTPERKLAEKIYLIEGYQN